MNDLSHLDDDDNNNINVRKTDSSGTEVWYKAYADSSAYIWNKGALSDDGNYLTFLDGDNSNMNVVLVDTSDGSANMYNHTDINWLTSSGDINIEFSPSSNYFFRSAASNGDMNVVGYVCRFSISDETYECKDFINGASGGGTISGFGVVDDDTIIVHWVWDQGSGLKHVFAMYYFNDNSYEWVKQADCVDECDLEPYSGDDTWQTSINIVGSTIYVAARSDQGMYMMTMSTSNGAISDFYEVIDMNPGNAGFEIWGLKFVSDETFFTCFDNNDYYFCFFYDFSTHTLTEFCDGNLSGWYTSSPFIDDNTPIIGGSSDHPNTFELDLDGMYYYGSFFSCFDYLELNEVTDASIFAFTTVAGPTNTIDDYTPDKTTYSGTDLTGATDGSVFYQGKLVAYPNDSTETMTVAIGFIGDGDYIEHVCYEDVGTDSVTYQPSFDYFYINEDISAYDSWLDFDTDYGYFMYNGAVAGSIELTVGVSYEDEYYSIEKTIVLDIKNSGGGHCLNMNSKGSCVVLAVFIAIICVAVVAGIIVAVVLIAKGSMAAKAAGSAQVSSAQPKTPGETMEVAVEKA